MSKSSDDIVVTGLGVLAPNGIGIHEFWENALEGRVATRTMRRFCTHQLQTTQAGEVENVNFESYFGVMRSDEIALSTRYACAAARLCIEDGDAQDIIRGSSRAGVCFGSVSSCRPIIESRWGTSAHGTARVAPVGSPCELSRMVATEWRLSGPNATLTTACAAGNSAIAWASDSIRCGRADMMVAGAADELSYAMLAFFTRLRAMSVDLVRPFDRRRNGLLLSEGSATVLLEKRSHAVARGARIYCKVAGYGSFSDSYHMTAPHPDALGAIRSIKAALAMAGLAPEDVGFISAHGTATIANDLAEAKAIQSVFGPRNSPPVSSLKSQIGHAQGAASAIEAVACVLTLCREEIHPTSNVTDLDPGCALDLVTARRPLSKAVALNNAFGFGGNICCVVFAI